MHVFDRDQRLVTEISEKDPSLTLAEGHSLYAFKRSAVKIASLEGDVSLSLRSSLPSAFVQREILAGIDTKISGAFVEVGVSRPRFA